MHIHSATRLYVVDFFCGAGGTSCGARMAGAHILLGIDRDPGVGDTFTLNNRNANGELPTFLCADVAALPPEKLREFVDPVTHRPLAVVGCPPCQPFTNLKTDKRRSDADRSALREFIRQVRALSPDYVVIENVPGIRSAKYGNIWADALNDLRQCGFTQIKEDVVNARNFGVPQNRRRTLLVGARTGPAPWPQATHTEQFVTVRDTLAGLPPLSPGQQDPLDPLHLASNLSPTNLKRIMAVPEGGGRRTWPDELQLDCYRSHDGHTDVYGRMHWDRPAPTLTTRFVSLSNGRFGHPSEHRAITPREGALLQAFPLDYQFHGTSRDMRVTHIGNAVPPLLAQRVFEAIFSSRLAMAETA